MKTESVDHLLRDLRCGLRGLRRSPAFTAIVLTTLALGIGANTAVFSIFHAALLAPLPFAEPDRLYMLYEKTPTSQQGSVSYPNFLDWSRDAHAFSGIAAFRKDNLVLTGEGRPERLHAAMLSAGFLSTLGVSPVIGHEFGAEDDHLGAAGVALISESLWRKRYEGSPQVLGRALELNGSAYTIVGVAPQTLQTLKIRMGPAEVYVPVGQWRDPSIRERKVTMGLYVVGRLKAASSEASAQADAAQLAANLATAYPEANRDIGINLVPLKKVVVRGSESMLLVLQMAVMFVLLIACTNVGNLLLVRSSGLLREYATRAALGASPMRIAAYLLMENLPLALGGGILGLLVASGLTRIALILAPAEIPRPDSIGINGPVVSFTLLLAVVAGILFGVAPARGIRRLNLSETLKQGGRGGIGERAPARRVLVVFEVALALVLLVAAGLMIRSLVKLWGVDPGFDQRRVLVFDVTPSPSIASDPEKIRRLFRDLTRRVESLSGIDSASMILDPLPLTGMADAVPVRVEGRAVDPNEKKQPAAIWYFVSPNYFRAMGISLKRGRGFTINDDEKAPQVAIVDEAFARSMFPGKDPIGKRITIGFTGTSEIVGVVGHVNHWNLGADPPAFVNRQMYFPYSQLADKYLPLGISGGATVVVRTKSDPAGFLAAIQEEAGQLDNGLAMFEVRTMEGIVKSWLASRRFAMMLLGVFAALALLLSALGTYGVVSYLVGLRRQEIAIRRAMGANAGSILLLVINQAGRLALLGLTIGAGASLVVARLLASMLYGISTSDPATLMGAATLLFLVSMGASYVPARKALSVDPLAALRSE
ncbi:MAG TPA: ABC transporter permease [Candidatus Angelobacter sp.]|nr:ABC transporter permease [Candidatus Angelobacter sp.]